MRHDPNLARLAAPARLAEARARRAFDRACILLGLLALALVPGRALLAWAWPS
ncbi:MAG TPA: hypothetical protein VGB57_05545 [Allosphingosinicella sp.]|jgi:hypothetical protein